MGGADRARGAAQERSSGSDSAKSTAELLRRSPGHCPQGHALASWIARQGHCDGCGRMVQRGERVMDCRACNWYLCTLCLPQREESSAFWDVLNYVVDSATQEMTELAADIAAFVPASCGAPAKANLATEELEVEPRGAALGERLGGAEPAGAGAAAPPAPPAAGAAGAAPPAQSLEGWLQEAPKPAGAAAPAPARAAAPAPDLLEFPDDLLDLSQEAAPAPAAPAPAPAPAAPAPAPAVPAPAPAPADDLIDITAPALAAPAPAPAPAPADDLIDIMAPAPAAPAPGPVGAGAGASEPVWLAEVPAPAPAAAAAGPSAPEPLLLADVPAPAAPELTSLVDLSAPTSDTPCLAKPPAPLAPLAKPPAPSAPLVTPTPLASEAHGAAIAA